MGVVMDSSGQHTQARQMFEKALQVNPADVSAINNLALSWLASGNPDKAILLIRSLDDGNTTGKLNLALVYLASDREEDARTALGAIAQPQRIDALIASLHHRLQQM